MACALDRSTFWVGWVLSNNCSMLIIPQQRWTRPQFSFVLSDPCATVRHDDAPQRADRFGSRHGTSQSVRNVTLGLTNQIQRSS